MDAWNIGITPKVKLEIFHDTNGPHLQLYETLVDRRTTVFPHVWPPHKTSYRLGILFEQKQQTAYSTICYRSETQVKSCLPACSRSSRVVTAEAKRKLRHQSTRADVQKGDRILVKIVKHDGTHQLANVLENVPYVILE